MNVRSLLRVGRAAPAMLLTVALTACSSLLPGKSPAPDLYALSALPAVAQDAQTPAPARLQLIVDTPLAARAIDTDRIAVRSDNYDLAYLAGARWNDSAPRVVQARLIETFERAHVATGVGRAEEGIRGDLSFVSDLRAFEVLTQGLSAPVIHVEIAAKLVTRPDGDVRSAQTFTVQVKAASSRERDIIAAFDQALTAVGGDATAWVRTVTSRR